MSIFDDYERGLEKLLTLVPRTAPEYVDILTLESRLRENIRDSRLYGDTPTLGSERTKTLSELNRITLKITISLSFNDLCSGKSPVQQPVPAPKPRRRKRSKKVFISHSSLDKGFVNILSADLQKAGFSVWVDQEDINVGDSIAQKVGDGLEESGYLVLVLSPNSVNSGWVQREIDTALMAQLGKKDIKILPLLLQNCEIPSLLRSIKFADFRANYQAGLDQLLKSLTA